MAQLMKIQVYNITLMLSLVLSSCSRQKVPEKVAAAFTSKFPTVTGVTWEMESEREWEATFRMGGTFYSANFSVNGKWKETERKVQQEEIPSGILSVLDEDFTDYKIEEAELVETPKGTFYEFGIEAGKEEFEVIIDINGKRITKATSKENDED